MPFDIIFSLLNYRDVVGNLVFRTLLGQTSYKLKKAGTLFFFSTLEIEHDKRVDMNGRILWLRTKADFATGDHKKLRFSPSPLSHANERDGKKYDANDVA